MRSEAIDESARPGSSRRPRWVIKEYDPSLPNPFISPKSDPPNSQNNASAERPQTGEAKDHTDNEIGQSKHADITSGSPALHIEPQDNSVSEFVIDGADVTLDQMEAAPSDPSSQKFQETPQLAITPLLDTGEATEPGFSRKPPQIRGVKLLSIVFAELSAQLGKEFSSAQLLLAAQQLIELSKSEYVGNAPADPTERAGYYSWDLVRAFNHAWHVAGVETYRMEHCDVEESSPEASQNLRLIQQGWGERTWEF